MKAPTLEDLQARLLADDAAFSAWRDAIPDKHWARLDLSALRLGYELGKAIHAPHVVTATAPRADAFECPHPGCTQTDGKPCAYPACPNRGAGQ